jgi:hypothetical protein
MSNYQDSRNSYQSWRDRNDAEEAAKQKHKDDYARVMSGDGLDEPPAEPKPKTVEDEVSALREQLSSVQQELRDRLTPRVVRSKMSNKEKAAYVGEHGSTKYFEIPWD